ncbi:MAG: DUF4258 domain-containing protein [bacterium]|nr:DUF4258 domain-containing protein [bacterium]
MNIHEIRDYVQRGQYKFSDHAVKRMLKRSIGRNEIEEVLQSGEIIEEYPDDKYSPSCLIWWHTQRARTLHVQVSLPPLVVVVTTYEPDPAEWINGKVRR